MKQNKTTSEKESRNVNIPKRTKTKHNESLKEKHCAFPGCEEVFYAIGAARFCMTHRDKKYRKIIDQSGVVRRSKKTLIKKVIENPNQIIEHSYFDTQVIEMKCALEGCNEKFSINLIQGVNVYPKYCPRHSNQFQRELFIQRRMKQQEDPKNPTK